MAKKKDLTPGIMKDIFNLINKSVLKRRCNRSLYSGRETISSLASKI